MSITDFEKWTFALDLENFEEIDSLYQSVKHISDYGMYRGNTGTGTCVKNRLKCRNQYLSNTKAV